MKINQKISWKYIVLVLALIGLLVAFRYGIKWYQEANQSTEFVEAEIDRYANQSVSLITLLRSEKEKNNEFQNQIRDIVGTVSSLNKLAQTDKELLEKYSKVYFLNEHYIPEKLAQVPSEYAFPKDKNLELHEKVLPYMLALLKDSKDAGMHLKITSAYRSFGEQGTLKQGYTVVYGKGTANQFSADQGYSEHQLGTTVDFTTDETLGNFNKFKTTPEYKWLKDNAYKYGFTLSYPEGNTYYQFEPWHWRFVGKNLARRLQEDKTFFYDLDQRVIDNYLISIFD
jgi:LAS superfamily LD-carboxypeptidase LdcB